MYVLLWPLISDSSLIPPNETLINGLSKALAIDLPNEVFPTPGGPTKQRIGPFGFDTLVWTAKYSIILSLTLSNPKWSSSKTLPALSKLILESVLLFQGIEVIQSM